MLGLHLPDSVFFFFSSYKICFILLIINFNLLQFRHTYYSNVLNVLCVRVDPSFRIRSFLLLKKILLISR
jgi:hypothetical protein